MLSFQIYLLYYIVFGWFFLYKSIFCNKNVTNIKSIEALGVAKIQTLCYNIVVKLHTQNEWLISAWIKFNVFMIQVS